MAALSDMTTQFLINLLITNPANANGNTNSQNTSFPLTLVVNGQLTTPITRQQVLNELNNRVAADNQNPSNPAKSYMGEGICGLSMNSNGTYSPISVLAPVALPLGPTPAQNAATANNGGSSPVPINSVQYVY